MDLVKTLENGNKVFSTVEMVKGVAVGYRVEIKPDGSRVRKWEPSFSELTGGSAASRKFGH